MDEESGFQKRGPGESPGKRLIRVIRLIQTSGETLAPGIRSLHGAIDQGVARVQPLAAATATRVAQAIHNGAVAGRGAIHQSSIELANAWSLTHHGWRRLFAAFAGRRARGLVILTLMFAVLAGALLPPAVALANALRDYQELRSLGESAVQHLLAAKADMGRMASPVMSFLQSQATPQSSSPYTLLVQRQAGTFYPFQATIHPSPQLTQQGYKTASLATVIGTDTPLPFDRTSTGTPSSGATPGGSAKPSPTVTGVTSSSDAGSLLDLSLLQAAAAELQGAQADFEQLRLRLSNPDWVLSAAGTVPDAGKQLAATHTLVDIGYDIATMGLDLYAVAAPLFTRLHATSLLSGQALLTQADLDSLQHALAQANQQLTSIAARLGSLDVSQLPISTAQKADFSQLKGQLPHLLDTLQQLPLWLSAAGWLLGVDQPRHFLVQTLDRAELRPSGGFTGDYGVLTVQGGDVEPFSLNNVNDIDYGYKSNNWIYGQRPPAQYAWWPFGNWGLRDSNLSADFPTMAQINIQVFREEGGGDVDGLIQFTPVAIEDVLRITGPIFVTDYDDTITADNLEAKLHYYQLDPAGIAKQQQLNPSDTTHSLRKRFTQLLAQVLQDKVRHLPANQLVQVARALFTDLRARDVQIFVANPQVESLLAKLHATGAVDTTPGLDGYMLVQANVSAAKSSSYVQITQRDDITLDDQGGATHRLTIQFANNDRVNVYGFQDLRDYVRIYTPPGARLLSGDGFDTSTPLCWAPLWWRPQPKPARFAAVPDCPANPYLGGEMVCPAGGYGPGPEAASDLLGTDGTTPWVLYRRGPPTATASDVPGRTMWGGYLNISPGCTGTLQLSWHVPGVVHAP